MGVMPRLVTAHLRLESAGPVQNFRKMSELVKFVQDATQVPPLQRPGTWQFMSAALQNDGKPYELSDDLESFMHLLTWCALKYLPHLHSYDPEGLASYFFSMYDDVVPRSPSTHGTTAPLATCTTFKIVRVRDGMPFVSVLPRTHPFAKVVGGLSTLCKRHYDTFPPPDISHIVIRPVVEVPAKVLPGARNRKTVAPATVENRDATTDAKSQFPETATAAAPPSEPEVAGSPLTSHTAFLSIFEEQLRPEYWEHENVLARTTVQIPDSAWRRWQRFSH